MSNLYATPRSCQQCGTCTTSQWRYAHNGSFLMCNACGIRWRRKNGSFGMKRRRPGPRAPSASMLLGISKHGRLPSMWAHMATSHALQGQGGAHHLARYTPNAMGPQYALHYTYGPSPHTTHGGQDGAYVDTTPKTFPPNFTPYFPSREEEQHAAATAPKEVAHSPLSIRSLLNDDEEATTDVTARPQY